MTKYVVRLTKAEQERLKKLITKGNSPVYKIRCASILLKADIEWAGMDGCPNSRSVFAASQYGC